jgi:hypothetical protein
VCFDATDLCRGRDRPRFLLSYLNQLFSQYDTGLSNYYKKKKALNA